MSKFEEYGRDDHTMQAILQAMSETMHASIVSMTKLYPLEHVVAMFAASSGRTLGELQAWHNEHAKVCEGCAKQDPEFYELFVKNFGRGFGAGKKGLEEEFAEGTAEANAKLEEIFKHGGKNGENKNAKPKP